MIEVLAQSSGISNVLLVIAAIVLVVTIGRILRRAKATDTPAGPEEVRQQIQRLHDAGDKIMAQIEVLGRDTVSRAETRLRVLAELLDRAERVTSTMEGAGAERIADRLGEVYSLADEGLDATAIAERTEFERGEVDLILSLRRKARSSAVRPESEA